MTYPRGIDLIAQGRAPCGAVSPLACMFCNEGHMLECHYGKTCEEADCEHHKAELEMDQDDPDRQYSGEEKL